MTLRWRWLFWSIVDVVLGISSVDHLGEPALRALHSVGTRVGLPLMLGSTPRRAAGGWPVLAAGAAPPDADEGVVEFIARYTIDGDEYAHHERSRFRKLDGDWYYVDGEMVKGAPVVRDEPKVGRNEPCPCGSGKKYKKCHGA